jgi:hypothetical protein
VDGSQSVGWRLNTKSIVLATRLRYQRSLGCWIYRPMFLRICRRRRIQRLCRMKHRQRCQV